MSDKKNLLNETQVRQFMKLAKLEPLASGFVEGLSEAADPDELEESEELDELRTGRTGALAPPGGGANPGHGRGQGEAADGSLFEEEAPPHELELDAADDLAGGSEEEDLEAAVDLEKVDGEEGVGADEVRLSVEDVLGAIKAALEDLYPAENIEAEYEEPAEEEEVEVADEFAPDGDAEVASDELELELQEGDKEEVEEGKTAEATDELVEQITKRVAARILKSALAKK